jgi:hypothetical protein
MRMRRSLEEKRECPNMNIGSGDEPILWEARAVSAKACRSE